MIFNREEECTKAEKEYYNTIGIYTLILFIGFVISLILYLFIDDPIYKIFILYISILSLISGNIGYTIYTIYTLIKEKKVNIFSWNIGYTIYKLFIKNIFSYFSIVLLVSCFVYSIIFVAFEYMVLFTDKVKEINNFEYPIYISFTINIIVLFLFWIFGSCEKIDHDCNVESWPDEFKTDALKSGREDFCNNLNETCMNDKNKSEDECGTCSDSKYNNEDDCNDNDGEWTSRYTKCFWSKPSDKKVSSCDITTDSPPLEVHEGSCVYDLDKCASINCSDFQPTTVFYDCCEENTRGWEENIKNSCDTLRSQIDANKTDEGRIGGGSQRAGELEAEYNLRVAASSQTSNIHNQDLYE